MDSVLDNCVRDDHPDDSRATDVPSYYGHAYVHLASSKVTRPLNHYEDIGGFQKGNHKF